MNGLQNCSLSTADPEGAARGHKPGGGEGASGPGVQVHAEGAAAGGDGGDQEEERGEGEAAVEGGGQGGHPAADGVLRHAGVPPGRPL